MKSWIKRKIVKLYYTIKGWNIERKMVVGDYYVSKHAPDSRYMYRGNGTFYMAYAKYVCPGVVYQNQEKKTFEHWEIGIFDFKKG